MKRFVCSLALVLAMSSLANATEKTATWTGAVNKEWDNAGNWAEGVIPGRYLLKDEDGHYVKDGSGNNVVAGEKGWTALFNRSDAHYIIDVGGGELISISNIVISGENNTREFGSSIWQSFPLEEGGRIEVEASAKKVPVFAGPIYGSGLTTANVNLHIINNSTNGDLVVTLGGKHKRDVDIFMSVFYRFAGSGTIEVRGSFPSPSGYYTYMSQAMSADGRLRIGGNASDLARMYVGSGLPKQYLEIMEGKYLTVGIQAGAWNEFLSDTDISGLGVLKVDVSKSQDFRVTAHLGATVAIGTDIRPTVAATQVGLRFNGNGDVVLSHANELTGGVTIGEGCLVTVPAVGQTGAAGVFGTGSTITLDSSGAQSGRLAGVRYVGSGETTDKTLHLANNGCVVNAGTGDLLFGSVTSASADCSLSVSNETDAAIGFTNDVPMSISVRPDAKVAFGGGAAINVRKVITAGDCTIRVDDGTAVSVLALERNDLNGRLDVTLSAGASLALPGLTEGLGPDWLRVNGALAKVDANGRVSSIAADDVTIDAHGGVIPNGSLTTVAITTATGDPSENVTLSQDAVSVLALRQRVIGEAATVVLEDGQSLTAREILVADGARPLVVAGAGQLTGGFALSGDGLVRSNADVSVRLASAEGAKVIAEGALTAVSPLGLAVEEGTASLSVQGTVPVSSVVVGDKATLDWQQGFLTQQGLSVSSPVDGLIVGKDASSVLAMGAGASFVGSLGIAKGDSKTFASYGSVYLDGGEITNYVQTLSYYGYAHLGMTGGRYVAANSLEFAMLGQIQVNITGGLFSFVPSTVRACDMYFGSYNTDASIYVCGTGVFDASRLGGGYNINIPSSGAGDPYRMQLTVEDGGFIDFGSQYVSLSGAKASATHTEAVFNFNEGGRFRAGRFRRDASKVYPTDDDPNGTATDSNYTNYLSLVQFNGGTFRNAFDWPFGSKSGTGDYAPSRITVFEKGATIDTSDSACTLCFGSSLLAPYGNGVESIALGSTVVDMTFVGPPAVRITGDGSGASAVCLFDRATGKVTGVKVTGRGNGYTTANAALYYGTYKTPVAALGTVSLTANVSGGLVKTGENALKLEGTNTYTGATVVKAGTLKLANDDVINAASALIVDGGTLDMNGRQQTFSDVSVRNGSVVNGQATVTGLTVDFNDTLAGKAKNIDFNGVQFAPGAKLVVSNFDATKLDPAVKRYKLVTYSNGTPDRLPELPTLDLPENWILRTTGGSVRISYSRGMMVLVR